MLRKSCLLLILPLALLGSADIVDAPYEPDYAKGYAERHLWKALRDDFMDHHYRKILRRHNLSLSCNGCSAIFMDVSLSVGMTGSVHIHRIDKTKACGSEFRPEMRGDFLEFLKSYHYPAGLRGTTVRLRLGSGLSC